MDQRSSIKSYLEKVTSEKLRERFWTHQPTTHLNIVDEAKLSKLPMKGKVDLTDNTFSAGLELSGVPERRFTLTQELNLDCSRLMRVCEIKHLSLVNILSLVSVDMSGATLVIEDWKEPTGDGDFWISFKDGTTIPTLVTDNEIIKKMFARLAVKPTAMVAYSDFS